MLDLGQRLLARLAKENEINQAGIYVFSYRTDVFAGSYSIGDIVETLHTYLKLDNLLALHTLHDRIYQVTIRVDVDSTVTPQYSAGSYRPSDTCPAR